MAAFLHKSAHSIQTHSLASLVQLVEPYPADLLGCNVARSLVFCVENLLEYSAGLHERLLHNRPSYDFPLCLVVCKLQEPKLAIGLEQFEK